jgi:hypothetical protein
MMAPKKLTLLALTLGLVLLGCTPTTTPSPPTPAPSTPTAEGEPGGEEFMEPGFNLLLAMEGEVLLKRAAWSDYHPTAFGTVLERGDLLKLSAGAQARVLCDSLTIWPVPAGAPAGLSSGCPQPPEPALKPGGAKVGPTRGSKMVPYIISPRATKLLTATPTLRWNDSGTELAYPGEPSLKPGVDYKLVVEDSSGRTSEGPGGLGFSLLEKAKADRVQADAERIAGLGLSSEAEAFALAQLYTGHGLIAEAIEILEDLIQGGSQQAAVHQALADLYAQIGLVYLAESRYLEAVELAEAGENVEGLAAIQSSLGEVYYPALDNKDKAIHWLTQAKAGYETLGDTQRVGELEERISELNK